MTNGKPLPLTLEDWLGLRLADEGLLDPDDVTVALVLPKIARGPGRRSHRQAAEPTSRPRAWRFAKRCAQLVVAPGEPRTCIPRCPG